MAVMEEVNVLIKDLFNVFDDYVILFLQGGVSLQFFMIVMNLLDQDVKVGYIDIGSWFIKVIKEVQVFGIVEILAFFKFDNFIYILKGFVILEDFVYVYIIINNIIYGMQFKILLEIFVLMVGDMFFDIFS